MESLNLADAALAVDPNYVPALQVRVDTLKELWKQTKNFNARSWISYGIRQSEAQIAAVD